MTQIVLIGPPLISIPPKSGGAIEKYIFELGIYLSKLNFKIIIFTIKDINNNKVEVLNENLRIVKVKTFQIPILRGIIYNFKVFLRLLQLKEKKIIWTNGISQILIIMIIKLFSKNIATIFTTHNIRPWFKTGTHSKVRDIIDLFLGIQCLRYSDFIITLTNRMKNYLNNRFLKENKFEVIPIGISKNILKKFPLKKYPEEQAKKLFQIIYIGQINKLKGLDILIESIHQINNRNLNYKLFLKIIGQLSNDIASDMHKKRKYLTKIRNLIKNLQLNNFVEFKGKLESSKVFNEIYDSDLYVLPSMGETFNLSALESLAIGTPIVITNSTGISEYLTHGKNCQIILKRNSISITNAIYSLLKNLSLTNQIKINSRKIVSEKFLWDNLIKKYEKFIRNILEKHKMK